MSTQSNIFPRYLSTERLTLEFFNASNPEHFEVTLETFNNPTAYAKMGDYGLRTHEDIKMLAKNIRVRELKYHSIPVEIEYLTMMVHLGDSEGPIVGIVTLCQRSPFLPPDIGWTLLERYMGHGYATEAAKEFLRFLVEDFCIKEIITWPDPKNKESNRVAEKLGFVAGGMLIDCDHGEELVPILILPGMEKFDGTKSISFAGQGSSL